MSDWRSESKGIRALCRKCIFYKYRGCARNMLIRECEIVVYTMSPDSFCRDCAYWNKGCVLERKREECVFWKRFLIRKSLCMRRDKRADTKRGVCA